MNTFYGLDLSALIAFAATEFLLCLTPGPAVLRVSSDAMQHGALRAQASIFGILAGNIFYFACAIAGLGAVVAALPALFELIKYCGIVYLIWLGVQAIRQSSSTDYRPLVEQHPAASGKLFRRSFLIQISNPKSILFFTAILPVFAGGADGAPMRMVVLGLVSIFVEYPILTAYGVLSELAARTAKSKKARRLVDFGSGLALIGAALLVARTTFERQKI